jgi:HPt (histidine-containing phosphotransfer) domain-containing protein
VTATTALAAPYADLLSRVGGSEALLIDVATLFLEDGPRQVDSIRRAVEAADANGVRRAVHSLRGSAAIFGAAALVALAQHLEEEAAGGDLERAAARLDELKALVERLRLELEQLVAVRTRPAQF